ncbi:internalin [Acinetobacter sp. CAAS 2-6]|uniref:internalin n=1 Tax=Acinetobacter sp. CAAS 2-6 TaxID=3016358 RepID=UPI002DD6720D|nr:internalin [Acinetobacter sp. CAAS 2-6]
MNKKLLICGLIATGLALSACVKKETPQEDEKAQTETEQQVTSEVEFKPLDNTQAASEAKTVTIIREETKNTTTEIRREVREQPAESKNTNKTETPKTENDTAQSSTPKSKDEPQTEEDAVAAAIAAASPALEK